MITTASTKRGEMSVLGVEKRGWRGVGRERGGKVSHVDVDVSMTAAGSRLYAAAVVSSKIAAVGKSSITVSSAASAMTCSTVSGEWSSMMLRTK